MIFFRSIMPVRCLIHGAYKKADRKIQRLVKYTNRYDSKYHDWKGQSPNTNS